MSIVRITLGTGGLSKVEHSLRRGSQHDDGPHAFADANNDVGRRWPPDLADAQRERGPRHGAQREEHLLRRQPKVVALTPRGKNNSVHALLRPIDKS